MTTQSSTNTPTGALNTLLMGQGVGTASAFSTATYPATTTINRIHYSTANNVVGELATANQGVLTTGTTGIPVITPIATNGQIIIGSTAGAPAAATLTAGANVTITNASNSITIAAAAGAGTGSVGGNSAGIGVGAGSTQFIGPYGVGVSNFNNKFLMPKAVTVSNLYVVAGVAPGAGQTFTFTIYKNNVATAVTCQISGAAATTANDTTHSFACVAGDDIACQVVTSGGAVNANFVWGITTT